MLEKRLKSSFTEGKWRPQNNTFTPADGSHADSGLPAAIDLISLMVLLFFFPSQKPAETSPQVVPTSTGNLVAPADGSGKFCRASSEY